MTNIRTVAAHAGVSPSTVSRAFARPEVVAEEARRRVFAAAAELGYQPNPVARSLAMGRTGNLGVIVPDIANPFFTPLIKEVQREARHRERSLFVADSDEHVRQELDVALAMARQVDGLVLASSRLPEEDVRAVAALTPVVTVSRVVDGVPAVATPSDQGIGQAVDHLVALGHRRLAYLGGPEESYMTPERHGALHAAAARRGLEVVDLGPFQPRYEPGVRAADLVMAEDVTAVLAYNDQIALGVVNRLTERGVRVPDQVSVLGIDDSWIAALTQPALTSVRVPVGRAGAVAVRMLAEPAPGAGTTPRESLATELIVRASTGPAPR
ncbi:LacI family DNA-binding transcriptional regulator [Geodermatophilus sp. CPCC 206100]|uniref:LacI family DNA-binding transcriptional regulator n=1 Tax=Geodermatophilus sp. CPCC 206100 TaxID=3020054 RepID=UPI003B00995B